jgi:uncharacterized protein (UPF0335 family)
MPHEFSLRLLPPIGMRTTGGRFGVRPFFSEVPMMNADLHDICTRIARLETERKELAAEVAKIKKDAKEDGYDAGLITKTVAIMLKSGKKQREAIEQVELFDTYLNAVGLLSGDRIVAVAAERLKPGDPVVLQPGDPVVLQPGDPVVLQPGERLIDLLETLIAEAEAFLPPHDPDTGEITEPAAGDSNHSPEAADGGLDASAPPSTIPISSAHCLPDDSDEGLHLRSAAGEHVSSVPPRPLAGSIDMGDIPKCMDRRARAVA